MKIGFFDSGLGGLLILQAVARALPQYDYEFYGDTAHVPYGDRTEEEIFQLTKAGVEHLFRRDCALVIVACNTASAETLRRLQDSLLVGEWEHRRLLGVIIPTIETIVDSQYESVGLFATLRTVTSQKYDRELTERAPQVTLYSQALPELVPLIEAGRREEAEAQILTYIRALQTAGVHVFVLGCTHYAVLKDGLRAALMGEGVIISQDEIIPKKLALYLGRHTELEHSLTRSHSRNIFLTAHKPEYDRIIGALMGGTILDE